MRIINILQNNLINKKTQLEEELERIINKKDISVQKQLTQATETLDKLSSVTNQFALLEGYLQTQEQNKN
jgi:hypothetical protein|tara:strand:+ start:89 stop:298 length:210 start_codon:yes stop_codon:yes gene_type:complete